MTQRNTAGLRRSVAWMAGSIGLPVLVLLQAGCGGALGGSNGGIGGSGIVAGPIEELGSIVVDGIRFEIDDASVVLNGDDGAAEDLDLGMFVTVHGSFDEEAGTGTATLVEFDESVSGPVNAVSMDRKRIVVLEQAVTLDGETRLKGLTPGGLRTGVVVTVSGSRDADGSIAATLVARRSSAETCRVVGDVEELAEDASSFHIGGLEVDASAAMVIGGDLVEGDSVGVLADNCDGEGPLSARQVRRLEVTRPEPGGPLRNVHGFVLAAPDGDRFVMRVPGVGPITVVVTAETVFEGGVKTDLSRNDLLKVGGRVTDAGILRAARIRFLRDSEALR
jgi:hypothetical protein